MNEKRKEGRGGKRREVRREKKEERRVKRMCLPFYHDTSPPTVCVAEL